MPDYYQLVRFFGGYNEHLKSFYEFELKKLDMINNGKIEDITKILPAEQALIMKTNSLEAERIKLLEGTAESFDQLAQNAPASCKGRLVEQHRSFREYVLKIKEINDTVNIIVSSRLKKSERSSLDTYDGHGRRSSEGSAPAATVNKNI